MNPFVLHPFTVTPIGIIGHTTEDRKNHWDAFGVRALDPGLNSGASRTPGELLLNADSYRKALPLDAYLALSENKNLSERVRNLLKTYLVELPGFHEDGALSGSLSPKVYEQHGYLTMQVVSLVAGVGERGKVRSYRMGSTKIDYTSERAIRQIKAFVDGEVLPVLIVELVHAEPGFKTVERSASAGS